MYPRLTFIVQFFVLRFYPLASSTRFRDAMCLAGHTLANPLSHCGTNLCGLW